MVKAGVRVAAGIHYPFTEAGKLDIYATRDGYPRLYSQAVADAPAHVRIATELRDRITRGTLRVGDHVPSESQLCHQWGVSRGPVRQALQSLRATGLIGGGPGRPAVVLSRNMSQSFETFLSFSRWVAALGGRAGQRTVEVAKRPAGADVAAALGLDAGESVVQVLRVRLLDGSPVMIERSSFVEPVGRLLFEFDCDSGSIYAFLGSRGVELDRARHVIDAVSATEQDSALLGIDCNAPLLREQRHAGNSKGELFEFSDDRYRPDVISFCIENSQYAPAALQRLPTTVQEE